jgi:hypothetical protein
MTTWFFGALCSKCYICELVDYVKYVGHVHLWLWDYMYVPDMFELYVQQYVWKCGKDGKKFITHRSITPVPMARQPKTPTVQMIVVPELMV